MHTKDILADALSAIGLDEMSANARTGYYHDFLSPLALPEMQLINDLGIAATTTHRHQQEAIMALRARVIDGEFDASAEESDEWAASEDGQDAFRKLVDKR
jgi:hypothetical protein